MKNIHEYDQFFAICKKSQKELKNYLKKKLQKEYKTVLSEDGYIFAMGDFPVLLVAHLDTVHGCTPKSFEYDPLTQTVSSPTGIGGDDRCGVYMILEVIKKYKCSVLFCEDEEIGCVGAQKFVDSPASSGLSFNYIIEFDRAHADDAVFYECINTDFETFVTKEFYKTSYGTFSDISVIAPALGVAAVNLSCGYYKAHTKEEYVSLTQMTDSINATCHMLARTDETFFEYVENPYTYFNSSIWSKNTSKEEMYGDRGWYLIEYISTEGKHKYFDTIADSEAEAIGILAMDDHDFSYNALVDINVDYEEAYYGMYEDAYR